MMLAALVDVTGQTALLVGGGQVALRHAQMLRVAEMRLRVAAPQLQQELAALCHKLQAHPFEVQDLNDVMMGNVQAVNP